MNAGFYSTPCSLTWPPRIHPIYEHHSVNKPPTKQRSMLSLHNLYWCLSYLRSDFINSLGCPAHPTVGYNLGKGLQGNSTCNPVTLKPHRWKGFFFFFFANVWIHEMRQWDTGVQKQWYSCFAAAFPNPCDVREKENISALSPQIISEYDQLPDRGAVWGWSLAFHWWQWCPLLSFPSGPCQCCWLSSGQCGCVFILRILF